MRTTWSNVLSRGELHWPSVRITAVRCSPMCINTTPARLFGDSIDVATNTAGNAIPSVNPRSQWRSILRRDGRSSQRPGSVAPILPDPADNPVAAAW